VQSIAIGLSVCLSVCLSADISEKAACPNFTKFFVCYLWQWLGPLLTAVQCISGLVNDVMISYNGANGPGRQVAAPVSTARIGAKSSS